MKAAHLAIKARPRPLNMFILLWRVSVLVPRAIVNDCISNLCNNRNAGGVPLRTAVIRAFFTAADLDVSGRRYVFVSGRGIYAHCRDEWDVNTGGIVGGGTASAYVALRGPIL